MRGVADKKRFVDSRESSASRLEKSGTFRGTKNHATMSSVSTMREPCDLLHPRPRRRIDIASVERALDFAFASGGAESALGSLLDGAEPSPSTWDPSAFEDDIFLDDLISRGFRLDASGDANRLPTARRSPLRDPTMRTLLGRPPDDRETILHRQAVVRELDETPAMREDLARVHAALSKLLALFAPNEVIDNLRMKQLQTLRAVHSSVLAMATGFEGARSALARIRALGSAIKSSEGFARLTTLLDMEGNMAALDVRLRVGSDGKLRGFEIAKIAENESNPLHASPFRRFLQRIGRWLRGYKFTDSEVLEELIDSVFSGVRRDLAEALTIVPEARFYLGIMGFADLCRSRGLPVCLPDFAKSNGEDAPRTLEGLFNPLLLAEPGAPTPCDLELTKGAGIAIFTGPNSGGKTRVLQAVAITQMLGQAGSFVPAKHAELIATGDMFVSLIDHEHADQREGRLGLELARIRDIFERARPRAIVIVDELCAGTNPSEGEEIFEIVATLLAELEPQAFVTTHFLDFAARLSKRSDIPSLQFFQVELSNDDEPTYRFIRGVAKSSLARKTAERLGVTREELEKLVARHKAASSDPPASPKASLKKEFEQGDREIGRSEK